MLDKETIGGDVVAVHYQAVRAGVCVPADVGSVISAPDPSVVDDGVVAVDLEIDDSATGTGSTNTEEDVVEGDGIFFVIGFAFVGTDLKQNGGLGWAGIEEEACDDEAVGVSGGHRCGAVDRMQRGKAEAHDDSVRVDNADRFGEIIDAGSQDAVFVFGELRVDGGCVIAIGVGDVELADGDGFSWCRGVPGDTGAVVTDRGNAYAVVAGGVDLEEGLFADDGSLRDLSIRRVGPFAFRWIGDADKDHVPVCAGPTTPLTVARDPLLLRAGCDLAVDEGVGHPASAGPTPVLVENDVALHVHAT